MNSEPNPEATPENIVKTQNELTNPRAISKDRDPVGRSETASQILQTRSEKRGTSASISEKEQQIAKISVLTTAFYQQEREKEQELATRTEKLIVKLKGLVGVDDKQASELQSEIESIQTKRNDLYQQASTLEQQVKALQEKGAEIPQPRELLDDYYEKIANSPLSNEQKRELLKPEVLSSLSTEQYIALWKRLNPHFLSHVTRQGFRDHNAMMYHSAGLQEFHGGFVGVMNDQRLLRPPMAIGELRSRDEGSVRAWMGDWVLGEETEEKAREKLDKLMNFHLAAAPKYPDKTAVHFAAQLVADDYYGGESGNEVFFIYPSDVIASQHDFAFNGWEKDFTQPQSETKWNDVFVWPETVENSGITIDAGMVFLPKNTPVDPETGSKYASEIQIVEGEEKRVMIEDRELISRFVEWARRIDDSSPIRQAFKTYNDEKNYYLQQDKKDDVRRVIAEELGKLGFSEDAVQGLAEKLFTEMDWRETFEDEMSEHIVRQTGAHYKRAENVVKAEDYWEGQFTQNPDLKPKHVVYYDGDPSRSVLEFQRAHGIGSANTSETEGKLLGFDDRQVTDMESDPRSNKGRQELMEIAEKIIREHYQGEAAESIPQN